MRLLIVNQYFPGRSYSSFGASYEKHFDHGRLIDRLEGVSHVGKDIQ